MLTRTLITATIVAAAALMAGCTATNPTKLLQFGTLPQHPNAAPAKEIVIGSVDSRFNHTLKKQPRQVVTYQ